jgi:molybdopterin-guanine dinucleotide biosynthesis protein A
MITGIVLCGGNSTRMGSDKGLLLHHNQRWAAIAFNKLHTICNNVLLSVNNDQLISYQSFFEDDLLIADDASLNIGGPLKGLLSVHAKYPEDDFLLLAVDMINMQTHLLSQLLHEASMHNYDTIIYKQQTGVEPLCGFYSSVALKKIMHLYHKGQLKKHSMHFVLEQLDVLYLDVNANDQNCFNNFNSKHDLTGHKSL